MPIYSYKCNNCSHSFDIRANLAEKEAKDVEKFKCPKCSATDIKQNLANFAYVKNTTSSSSCSTGTCPFA